LARVLAVTPDSRGKESGMHRLVAVDERYARAQLQLRATVLHLRMTFNTAHDLAQSNDDPFESLAAIRDRVLRMGRRLTDFIDEHQPR
jgi:hypothetical protein